MRKMRFVLKWICYLALTVLARALQSVLAPRLSLFGAVPDFLPALTVCAACLEGSMVGGVLGILAGVLCGASSELGILWAPFYFTAAYMVGRLTETRLRANFLTALGLSLALTILLAALRGAPALLRHGVWPSPAVLGGAALFTAGGSVVLYPLMKGLRCLTPDRERRRGRALP